MSDTPKNADECKKLLDNGWGIVLYKNQLGSYTACAVIPKHMDDIHGAVKKYNDLLTDDFEPSQALYRLTEKVLNDEIA